MINKADKNKGYAILELLFYIGFFSLLSLVVINAMITMAQSFRETEVYAELSRGGAIMERIGREVRQAESVSSISANSLKLNTTDDAGASKTVEFALSGTNVRLLENNVLTGNLNTPGIIVSALSFTEVSTAEGTGVKMILTIRSVFDKHARSVDFYNTIVLRGSY